MSTRYRRKKYEEGAVGQWFATDGKTHTNAEIQRRFVDSYSLECRSDSCLLLLPGILRQQATQKEDVHRRHLHKGENALGPRSRQRRFFCGRRHLPEHLIAATILTCTAQRSPPSSFRARLEGPGCPASSGRNFPLVQGS